MIHTGVDNTTLLQLQPQLASYKPSGQTTWDVQITEALRQIIRELKKGRKDLKKYCTPVELQALVTILATTTSTLVADDIDRMLWRVIVTEFNAPCGFELFGTNDDGATLESCGTLSFAEAGTQALVFNTTFKQYKITATVTGSTTYRSDLIESSFYHAHLWLSIALAFKTVIKQQGDRMDYLSQDYMQKYLDEMNSMVATYDDDASGDISTEEMTKVTAVEFLR